MQRYQDNIDEDNNAVERDESGATDFWDRRPALNFISSMLLLLAIAGCLIAVVFTMNLGHGEIISEFYVLGKDHKAVDYTTEINLGETAEVVLGITNHEYSTQAYLIEISSDNTILDNIGPITLENGQKWEQVVAVKPVKTGANQKVDFVLERQVQNSSELNKPLSLYLFVNVK